MAFVEDMIFVVGLTGLVYFITDELLVIASVSHKLGSSRIDLSKQNRCKDSAFSDDVQKDSVFNDAQEAKVNDFEQRECSGVEQSVVFHDAQEAKVDDFVLREDFFNDTQEVKVDDFVQRECCSGVGQSCNGEFGDEIDVVASRKCGFGENDCVGGDGLVDQVVDQNFEYWGLDQGVEELFETMPQPQGDEWMAGEENVCFNVGDEVDKEEEEGWEDDWEGIERTELERLFGVAVAFVNSKKNAHRFFGVESKVKIKLYALHKVVIEGICMKPQPMALKVYSRAKWNAWKQLENMSRVEAMEKYITLLSRTIPGWMEDRHKLFIINLEPSYIFWVHKRPKLPCPREFN
ncbi:hypothetical protein DCAR_0729624 [Daucus carota subsp. sativus]|uniref:ACB domain-containing protein n=1 Tax=Daucus carota subsp. sativus TaxID=79200 RepID=A0AAF1BBF9_DAUCS|nr:hypothetical protein DCAR_0729624 [Daucus carota subsp. sativus]